MATPTHFNMTNGINLGVITATNGGRQFTDLPATNYPMRYYRFKAQ